MTFEASNIQNINDEDYYSVLRVSSTARLNEIKKSFRTLQRQAHPDSSKTAATRHISAKLNESYQVLSNPLSRLEYDLLHGFKQNTEQNRSQLQEFKRRKAQKLRESLSASAQRSRDIESNVSCTFSDGTIVKNCGLVISKAKYGFIDLEKRSRAVTATKKPPHMPPLPRSVTITHDDLPPPTNKKRSASSAAYDSDIESAHHNTTNNKALHTEYTIDVTDAVQCLITHRGQNGGYIEICDNMDKSTLDGFYIPSSSVHNNTQRRYLEIEYLFNRKYHYVKVTNFEYLCVPNQSHIVHIFDAKDPQKSVSFAEETDNDDDHNNNEEEKTESSEGSVPFMTAPIPHTPPVPDPIVNNEIIELPSGKLAVQSRPSLVGLKKFSEIEKLRKEERMVCESESKISHKKNKMYDLIKWSVGLMVVGAIGGLGYYLVDKAKRQSRNDMKRKDDNDTAMAVLWGSQDSLVLYIQKYWNWMLGREYNKESDKN